MQKFIFPEKFHNTVHLCKSLGVSALGVKRNLIHDLCHEAITSLPPCLSQDERVHGSLFLIMSASANVEALKGLSGLLTEWGRKKPLVSCILAPPSIWDAQIEALENAGALVNYATPECAARVMRNLWEYGRPQSGND